MSLVKRHLGFAKWVVEADGARVFGPGSKEGAEAYIESAARAGSAPTKQAGNREYLERLAADMRKPVEEELAELRTILARRRDEDEVNIIVRQIEPILKAGKQAGRRERMRFMVPARQAAPAAA